MAASHIDDGQKPRKYLVRDLEVATIIRGQAFCNGDLPERFDAWVVLTRKVSQQVGSRIQTVFRAGNAIPNFHVEIAEHKGQGHPQSALNSFDCCRG